MHAALSLVLTLFGVAVQFVALEAHFLAAVQVIVYAGAIVVLFLFVIMLLGVDRAEDLRIEPIPIQRPLAAVVGVGDRWRCSIAADRRQARDTVAPRGRRRPWQPPSGRRRPTTPTSSSSPRNLFTDYVFAFELTSVLLVVAVVGTVLLTRQPARASSRPRGERRHDRRRLEPTTTWYLVLGACCSRSARSA